MTDLFQEVNETPELPEPSVQVLEKMRDYFAPPDLSDCFTVPMVEATGLSRHKARSKVKAGVKNGEIEYVMRYGGTNYYRFVGKNDG